MSGTGDILVTGAAGFIGFYVCNALLDGGRTWKFFGNLNAYYDVGLKRARLARLEARPGFTFHEADIADHEKLAALPGAAEADVIVHLAAQAGVRYSLDNPFAYASSNLTGHLSVLELARRAPRLQRLVYASSSSVYGGNTKVPFCETDPVERPLSLYAATKRADEMMSEAYARLYGVAQIGLRFFTVYGPWGRPDMAYWLFAEKIFNGEPIRVFNHGDLERDFTYIDDIVAGVVSTALEPMKPAGDAPHRIYNIGNNRPVKIERFIEVLETAIGKKAEKVYEPMAPGDVRATYADISAISADYGFAPATPLEQGIPKFIDWFRAYRKSG